MRTYSHAVLTYAALRLSKRPRSKAMLAALGATLPDLPAGVGVAWLWTEKHSPTRRDFEADVCGRNVFRLPDAAAHSLPVLLAALFAVRRLPFGGALLLGWGGHLLSDFLTHSSDARPQLWPLSEWRFRSPVSYRDKDSCGRIFAVAEHALVISAVVCIVRDLRRFRS